MPPPRSEWSDGEKGEENQYDIWLSHGTHFLSGTVLLHLFYKIEETIGISLINVMRYICYGYQGQRS
jgi:hypothetical protein